MRTLTEVFAPGAPTLDEGLRTLVVSPERELEPGMTVRAGFTFRNRGGAAATGVRVRFSLPEGLVYLVGTGRLDGVELDEENGGSPLLQRGGAEIGDVAPGEERRIEICYSVAGAIENGSVVELQAAVAAFELAPVGSNVVRLVARSRPALRNAMTAVSIEPVQQPAPGSEAAITVRVHNAGESSAHDVVVVAPVPAYTSYIPHSVRVNGREFERDLPAPFDCVYAPVLSRMLPASGTVTLQYRVRIDDPLPDGAAISARAEIASQETPSFSLQPAVLCVASHADFDDERTIFTVEPAEAVPGTRVTMRLRAFNCGTTTAENVVAAFTLPEGLIAVRGSSRIDERPLRERKKETATIDLGAIPAREAVELCAEAIVAAPLSDGAALPVQALLRWRAGSGAEAARERRFERTMLGKSLPFLPARRNGIERIGDAVRRPGDECEAIVTIANDGTAPLTDALLSLRADTGLEDVRAFERTARVAVQNDTVALGVIEPYSSRRLTVRARIRTPQSDRRTIRLAAGVHSQELGETQLGEVRWTVDSHPAFSTRTSALTVADHDVLRPNQLADVYVHLHNEGTDAAQNVRLQLYVSPEARLESAEGATRERSTLVFGEIAPGAASQARLGVRLLRSAEKDIPLTIEAVLFADAMLPVQLEPLAIAMIAEPSFAVGTLTSEPAETAEAGDEVQYTLHLRNSGDGPARRARIEVDRTDALLYVPNSTFVNELPVRDAGAQSPLSADGGVVLTDVDPGVEAAIHWREVVRNDVPATEGIVKIARVTYDGERVDEIAARVLKIRCGPAFASGIAGLPFGLDGVIGAPHRAQRALTSREETFIELPPATPVARPDVLPASMLSLPAAGPLAETSLVLGGERLERLLRFLPEARFGGLAGHLFAVRGFFPDAIAGDRAPLERIRGLLHEALDRLFIKLRLPHYVIAPRDLETPALRAELESLVQSIAPGASASEEPGLLLQGGCDVEEMRSIFLRLHEAPAGTAFPWMVLARLLPSNTEAAAHYRALLVQTLDDLADAAPTAFIDALQRKPYPLLDAALDILLTQMRPSRV